jgi:hypothetical protein
MKKRHLNYSLHLITYIDILGFRELVEKKDPNFISKAIREVRDVTTPSVHVNKYKKENYVNFSDLIVHSVPFVENSDDWKPFEIVVNQVKHIALVQAVLIERSLLVRGAITIGAMERSYGVLFGPGLISAYELERDQALFSRIVVDAGLFKTLEQNRLLDGTNYDQLIKQLSKCLKRDDDGVVFVDYLGFMGHVLENDRGAFLNLVAKHKALIERNLRRFRRNKKVLSKYLWLRKYHNAVIRAKFRNGQSKLHIDMPDNSIPVSSLTPDSN